MVSTVTAEDSGKATEFAKWLKLEHGFGGSHVKGNTVTITGITQKYLEELLGKWEKSVG